MVTKKLPEEISLTFAGSRWNYIFSIKLRKMSLRTNLRGEVYSVIFFSSLDVIFAKKLMKVRIPF